MIPHIFDKGDYFCIFDLKWGYHHNYGCATWASHGVHVCHGNSLVVSACYVFTELMRPLVRRWRSAGLKENVYIDDGICSANSIQVSVLECEAVASDLKNATGSPSKKVGLIWSNPQSS